MRKPNSLAENIFSAWSQANALRFEGVSLSHVAVNLVVSNDKVNIGVEVLGIIPISLRRCWNFKMIDLNH